MIKLIILLYSIILNIIPNYCDNGGGGGGGTHMDCNLQYNVLKCDVSNHGLSIQLFILSNNINKWQNISNYLLDNSTLFIKPFYVSQPKIELIVQYSKKFHFDQFKFNVSEILNLPRMVDIATSVSKTTINVFWTLGNIIAAAAANDASSEPMIYNFYIRYANNEMFKGIETYYSSEVAAGAREYNVDNYVIGNLKPMTRYVIQIKFCSQNLVNDEAMWSTSRYFYAATRPIKEEAYDDNANY